MECILFAGINFDLRLDIPHNYVNKMCKKAFGSVVLLSTYQ